MKYNSAVLCILGLAFGVLSIGTSMGCGNRTAANSKAEIKTIENISCKPMQKLGFHTSGSVPSHFELILDPELGFRVTNIKKYKRQCTDYLLNSEADLQIVPVLHQIFLGKCQVSPLVMSTEPTGAWHHSFFEDLNGKKISFEGFVNPEHENAFKALKSRLRQHMKLDSESIWEPC